VTTLLIIISLSIVNLCETVKRIYLFTTASVDTWLNEESSFSLVSETNVAIFVRGRDGNITPALWWDIV